MRQLFLDKGNMVVKEVCQPMLDDNNMLVSVHYSFLGSGSELSTIEKAKENIFFSNFPQKIKRVIESVSQHGVEQTASKLKNRIKGRIQPLGYSCSGEVIAVGKNVTHIRPGDLVACAGASFAMHADIINMPQNLVTKISSQEFLKDASLATIGTLALQSVRKADLKIGEYVCIVGMGILGQITLQMANLCGCNCIAIDIVQERLKKAKQLGAISAFHAIEDNVINEIEFITNHHGVDCTIITACSKSDALIQQAMEMTRKKGKVIVVSDIGLNIDRNPFYKKEVELLVSCSYGPGRNDYEYEQLGKDYPYEIIRWTENRNLQAFIQLIENKKIDIKSLITDNININKIDKAYSLIKSRKTQGIIINYLPKKSKPKEIAKKDPQEITFKPAVKDCIRVGIVGAGGFSKLNIAPIIAQQEQVKINAIVDKNISNSMNMSKIYGATKCFTSDKELFEQNAADVVVISSEHKYHCAQALHAMEHAKAVFLEKPMVTSFEQLDTMIKFLTKNPNTPFCVDYSRSFSPLIQKIKKAIKKRRSPLIINYRMNVELLKKNRFAQADMGEGRIIGEACSIFDLFCFLTNSQPIAVSVESLHSSQSQLFPTDNFCAQVSFQDGSICSLVYTSLGNQDLGRERMELFFDSKAIVMRDYRVLQGFGLRKIFDECNQCPNKGRSTLISNFFANIQNKKFKHPIELQRLFDVANLTLTVDQLACQGGGEKTFSIKK
ncbi:bi-domain-containing oxidoreductase [Candidatus Dependentiae bacterium]